MLPPRILDIQVDWALGWNNSPSLHVLLTREASQDEFRYEERSGSYFAVLGDQVDFMYHSDPPDEQTNGYGGRAFELTMQDGRKVTLVGPWSSRCGAMNARGFVPSTEASVTADPVVMKRGYTFMAGAVTVNAVQGWLTTHSGSDWTLRRVERHGDSVYEPILKRLVGGSEPCEQCKGHGRITHQIGYAANFEPHDCGWCGGSGLEQNHKKVVAE